MIKIATFNVNSIKARLPNLTLWLREVRPDVVLLQEIKCMTDQFPELEIGDLGYNLVCIGQKTYNGVAILSRHPLDIEHTALPGGDGGDDQARYIQAVVSGGKRPIRVASIYLPNGNPAPGPKFDYKLAWMRRLTEHAKGLLETEEATVLGGDYNVVPTDMDVYDPIANAGDALCRPETRTEYRTLVNQGWTDALRIFHPEPGVYTYWDYQAGRWQRDQGWRIDHLLLSPQAADRLTACEVDKAPRGREKASDHTPVWCELEE
jgi:exodeoxyribonuclease III